MSCKLVFVLCIWYDGVIMLAFRSNMVLFYYVLHFHQCPTQELLLLLISSTGPYCIVCRTDRTNPNVLNLQSRFSK